MQRAFFGMKIIRFCRNFSHSHSIISFLASLSLAHTAIWNESFFSAVLSFMLMEIVCLSDMEVWWQRMRRRREMGKRVSGKGKRILDLHQSTFMSNFTLFRHHHHPDVHIDCDTTWKWYYLQIIQLSFHVR